MKHKSLKFIKIISIVLAAIILIGCLSALIFVHKIVKSDSYVHFDSEKLNQVHATFTILDNSGQQLKEPLYVNNVKQIPLSALHDYTYMAFVAVEDKRFFSHKGLDYRRCVGALFHNVKSGSFKEGASTISQQLIKNTHLDNSKTLRRKINEMILATEMENTYSKQEILEMYLNTIYFGRNAYGLENAANVYFDKSAADLTVAESAALAGMVKAPNVYAPDKNTEKCVQRRNTVLKLMLEQGIISQKQHDEAAASKLAYCPYVTRNEKNYTAKVVEEACRLLNMTPQQLYSSDFVIETYCDSTLQQQLQQIGSGNQTQNKDGTLCDLAYIVCQNDGGIAACYFRGEGAEIGKQIGSTAKPIAVYTPALCEKLITQASPVLDEPTDFGGYKPCNANGYHGWTTVKNAVVKSLNVPAVKTLNTLGLEKAQRYLQKLGFGGKQNLSLALGNVDGGMTPKQLINCYVTLANGGTNCGVSYIKHIYSEKGEIYTRTPQNMRVYDEASAYLMTDMLKEAAKTGTARKLASAHVKTAAKTGTVGNSTGNTEALVAGYTTQHTYVFWYSGNFDNSVSGATLPCETAAKVLSNMYGKNKPADFTPPKDVLQLKVDTESLYDSQLLRLSDSGEKFWFDSQNRPHEKVEPPHYNYKLCTEICDGEVFLKLPQVAENLQWKVYKIDGGETEMEITECGGCANTCKIQTGTYCGKLYCRGKCIYTTPKIAVRLPQ